MSSIYDKLKRLVEATLKRKQICDIALYESLISSGASDIGSDSFREDVAGNTDNNGVKEVTKKDSFEEGSGAHSNSHVNKASSGRSNSWNVIAWTPRILDVVKSGWRIKNKLNSADSKKKFEIPKEPTVHIAARTFTFCELAAATRNFRPECLLGEDEVGRVFKGQLKSTGQVVAVKHLDSYGDQTNQEYSVEVLVHCPLHHPNIVNLIGYCADGNHRLLVYEYTTLGSLKDNLHDLPSDKEPLDWNTRMKIAAGVAKALEYLHDKANPPFIHRDLKPSNILLDEGYFPKLSNFRLAKLGSVRNKNSVSTSVKGTYGYCAPEYGMIGLLTSKADVYNFGVVFLELITVRKAIDNTRGKHINLVTWAWPLFMNRRKFPKMVDPLLRGRYPPRGLYQGLHVACMCLQEKPAARPPIRDVVTAVTYLASQTYDPDAPPTHSNEAGPSTQNK